MLVKATFWLNVTIYLGIFRIVHIQARPQIGSYIPSTDYTEGALALLQGTSLYFNCMIQCFKEGLKYDVPAASSCTAKEELLEIRRAIEKDNPTEEDIAKTAQCLKQGCALVIPAGYCQSSNDGSEQPSIVFKETIRVTPQCQQFAPSAGFVTVIDSSDSYDTEIIYETTSEYSDSSEEGPSGTEIFSQTDEGVMPSTGTFGGVFPETYSQTRGQMGSGMLVNHNVPEFGMQNVNVRPPIDVHSIPNAFTSSDDNIQETLLSSNFNKSAIADSSAYKEGLPAYYDENTSDSFLAYNESIMADTFSLSEESSMSDESNEYSPYDNSTEDSSSFQESSEQHAFPYFEKSGADETFSPLEQSSTADGFPLVVHSSDPDTLLSFEEHSSTGDALPVVEQISVDNAYTVLKNSSIAQTPFTFEHTSIAGASTAFEHSGKVDAPPVFEQSSIADASPMYQQSGITYISPTFEQSSTSDASGSEQSSPVDASAVFQQSSTVNTSRASDQSDISNTSLAIEQSGTTNASLASEHSSLAGASSVSEQSSIASTFASGQSGASDESLAFDGSSAPDESSASDGSSASDESSASDGSSASDPSGASDGSSAHDDSSTEDSSSTSEEIITPDTFTTYNESSVLHTFTATDEASEGSIPSAYDESHTTGQLAVQVTAGDASRIPIPTPFSPPSIANTQSTAVLSIPTFTSSVAELSSYSNFPNVKDMFTTAAESFATFDSRNTENKPSEEPSASTTSSTLVETGTSISASILTTEKAAYGFSEILATVNTQETTDVSSVTNIPEITGAEDETKFSGPIDATSIIYVSNPTDGFSPKGSPTVTDAALTTTPCTMDLTESSSSETSTESFEEEIKTDTENIGIVTSGVQVQSTFPQTSNAGGSFAGAINVQPQNQPGGAFAFNVPRVGYDPAHPIMLPRIVPQSGIYMPGIRPGIQGVGFSPFRGGIGASTGGFGMFPPPPPSTFSETAGGRQLFNPPETTIHDETGVLIPQVRVGTVGVSIPSVLTERTLDTDADSPAPSS